ncbi:uncharacterized protein DSM5745_08074 [Aspergillus mulundensis]|uniref:C2H2-type domain-containing protein n=1 Tax=Aspergillus mulundensis TaxID=1810919 RepID=A0A3D8R929_9EURO|nr:hypothetical protein DSM5745_08074 [Aspergillus mulundensis]RDW70563.1 hypothetical protein DSM5745_08074 [Aspergillus mulundensis]
MHASTKLLTGLSLALVALPNLVAAACKLNNAIEENEKTREDRQELCLAEGPNRWTFALQISEVSVPTFDGGNPFAGIAGSQAFILYDDVCTRMGVYSPDNEGNDCGIPYTIEESWLSHALTVTSINFDVGDPFFKFSFAEGEYASDGETGLCSDISSGLRAEQACQATFSNYVEFCVVSIAHFDYKPPPESEDMLKIYNAFGHYSKLQVFVIHDIDRFDGAFLDHCSLHAVQLVMLGDNSEVSAPTKRGRLHLSVSGLDLFVIVTHLVKSGLDQSDHAATPSKVVLIVDFGRDDTKEKPFGCDKCTKSFTRKDLLVRHERLAHSSSPAASTPGSVPTASTQPVFDGLNVLASAVTDHPFPSTGEPVLPASHVAFPTAPAPEPAPFSEPFPYEGDDFTSFLDSIPLPSHPYSPTYQPLPLFPPLQFDSGSEYPSTLGHDGAATPSRSVLPRHGTQLPSLQLEESQPPSRNRPPKVPIVVTTQCRDRLVRELRDYANVIPDQSIPSRHALSRCLTGYLTGYHDHYPFLHIPTLNIEATPLHLVLSMAALGAQYCREHDTSINLFQVAKAVTMEHMRRDFQWNGLHDHQAKQASSNDQSQDILETIQSLLMLMSVSSWFEHYPPHYESLYLRSPMETLMRKDGLNRLPRQDGSWESWIRNESAKRTKLIVFCFLGIQTIVFDVPPNILTEEITLDLPCTENEWTAASASEWMQCRQYGRGSPRLQDALNSLFTRTPSAGGQLESFTSLGGYALIHALIQIIWLIQKACRVPASTSSSLSPTQITSLEHALENWCQCWERNQESSTDPFNPNGPISFTSTALLRMAYIRLNADFSSARRLQTFNPDEIARSLRQNLTVQRSDRLTRAALHCAHALSTPIKLGINYVARTLVVSWSNQYALCSLECAVLLAKWLEIATVPNPEPRLTEQETKLLEFVIEMVMEAQHGVSRSWLLANNTRLSAVVTRLWARLFTADYIYELVNLIGRSLNRYADLLEGMEAP